MTYDRFCIASRRRAVQAAFANRLFVGIIRLDLDAGRRFLRNLSPTNCHSPPVDMDEHRVRTIVVVEDDPGMLRALSRLLSAHGFRVASFTSAESFLAGVAQCEAACLVVDIHLGGISGIDLKRRLTSSGSDLPVIFMTAVESEATRREAVDAGCVAFLRKPFLAKLLIDAIKQVA